MSVPTLAVFAALAVAMPWRTLAAQPDDGKVLLDLRIRNESADQDNLPKQANGLTVRTRLGYETSAWLGWRVLLEGESVVALDESYNSTRNHKTTYPIIGDPPTFEVNRAQVSWDDGPFGLVAGRQRLQFDNQRFIGNSGFRQNEQTFDAIATSYRIATAVSVTYAYIGKVHRTAGGSGPQGQWDSNSHLLRVQAKTAVGQLVGYGYLLDLPTAPTQSSETWGLRLAGSRHLSQAWVVDYVGEASRQTDYRSSPTNFDLGYAFASIGLRRDKSQVLLGYERLDGDGHRGFQTPLASFHPFEGWAGVFTTTPANGVQDLYVSASTSADTPLRRKVRLLVAGHDFESAKGAINYGRELDVQATMPITPHVEADLSAARFEGHQPAFPDRTRVWVTLEVHY